jgi:hypothetical protein
VLKSTHNKTSNDLVRLGDPGHHFNRIDNPLAIAKLVQPLILEYNESFDQESQRHSHRIEAMRMRDFVS